MRGNLGSFFEEDKCAQIEKYLEKEFDLMLNSHLNSQSDHIGNV